MFDTVRQFGITKQVDNNIPDSLVELVGHRSGLSVPRRVLPSFSGAFQEFSNVPYVALSETLEVGLPIDQRLPDELSDLKFPRRLMYGICAPPNVVEEVIALFLRFGHTEDMGFLGQRANRSGCMGRSTKEH